MKRKIGLLFLVCLISVPSLGAILVETGKQKTFGTKRRATTQNSVRLSDGLNLRKERRMGVGISTAGPTGLLGLNIELNFTPRTSFRTGFGLGNGYNTFHMEIRRMVSGTWFVPYMAAGLARWSGNGRNSMVDVSPTFLSERFLSKQEAQSGRFTQNILYPGLGIQYFQLRGDYAGSSVYAEVLMMIDLDDFVAAPTGEVGYVYYF